MRTDGLTASHNVCEIHGFFFLHQSAPLSVCSQNSTKQAQRGLPLTHTLRAAQPGSNLRIMHGAERRELPNGAYFSTTAYISYVTFSQGVSLTQPSQKSLERYFSISSVLWKK